MGYKEDEQLTDLMPFPPASGPKPRSSASSSRVWAGLAKKVDNPGFSITMELKKN